MKDKKFHLSQKQRETATKMRNSPALVHLLSLFKASPQSKHLRFGQWFYNNYLTGKPWPELFHADLWKATDLIYQWLQDNQYNTTIPRTLKEREDDRA